MQGLMQDWPLLVHKILDHAALNHGDREIVTRSIEGPIRRTNYRAVHARARRVAKALEKAGVNFGDRVATMAWIIACRRCSSLAESVRMPLTNSRSVAPMGRPSA